MADLTREDVIRIAKENGVDPALALAHWQQETSGGTNAKESVTGAVGHFQLMPDTFAQMHPEGDINNPVDNATAGIKYLKHLGERFPGNREAQIAAYFAGPTRVAQYGGDVSQMGNVKDPNGMSVPNYVSGVMKHYENQMRPVEFEGQTYHFPVDTTDAEILSFFESLKPAPSASQADVRKSEPAIPVAPRSDWLKKISPVSGPEGLLPEVATAPLKGLNIVSDYLGGKATDIASNLGASPETAAGIGTAVNLGSTLPFGFVKAPGALRAAKALERSALTEDAVSKAAAEELMKRTKDVILTPPQITGEQPGFLAGAYRSVNPKGFASQEAELQKGAQSLAEDTLYPASQPSRTDLGQRIIDEANSLRTTMSNRLKPAFDAAEQLVDAAGKPLTVNTSPVVTEIEQALALNDRIPGGKLAKTEKDDLEALSKELTGMSGGTGESSLQGILGFISRQKEKLREMPDASGLYRKVLGDMVKTADDAYVNTVSSLAGQGQGDVVKKLFAARADWKTMEKTLGEDALQKAVEKDPEAIGHFLWQGGKVSAPLQLGKMLALAEKEGTMSAAQIAKINADMARGFLQEALPNLQAAANWSTKLKGTPGLSDTWNTLTSNPGGAGVRSAMDVLEKAAQMALQDNPGNNIIPLTRAAAGGAGYSMVTGTVHPVMMALGVLAAGVPRMLSTAYLRGDTGIINRMTQLLRLSRVGTPAAARALAQIIPDLQKFAAANQIDLFQTAAQSQEQP